MSAIQENLHFIIDESGQIVGDFERGDGAYGFLRNRKSFSFDEATNEERSLLVHLVYLFFTVGDTLYHNDYEYLELEGYTIYRKVRQMTDYNDLFFTSRQLPDAQYLYLTIKDPMEVEYYVLTTSDAGFADALCTHYAKNYGMVVEQELIVAETSAETEYWDRNLTFVQR